MGLLHTLLQKQKPLSFLAESGITRESFFGNELAVYDMIVGYVANYGAYPKLETITAETKVAFPAFPDEPIEYWIAKVDQRHQSRLIMDATAELTELAGEGKILKAKQIIRDLWLQLEIKGKADRVCNLSQAAVEVVRAHDERQRFPGMKGVPFGLEYLDVISDGAQGSDTVAVCGRPGVGKSMFCLAMANYAYNADEAPLVVSMEMPTKQCARRLIALRTGIPATLIRLGRLSYFGRDKLVADVSRLQQVTGDHPFYLMQGSLISAVEDLVVRVRELKPTCMYVDGAYLLRSKAQQESRWERVTYTAEFLKMIATEFNIPVIATYQFNRRGPGSLGNIAFADSIGMLASIVIGISDESVEEANSWVPVSFKIIELLKGREGEKGVIRCIYDMARTRILQDKVLKGAGMQALATEETDEKQDDRGT